MIQDRSRQKKRHDKTMEHWQIIIKNLPQHFNKEDMIHYIWKTMENCRGLIKPGNPIINSRYSPEQGNILVLNFRTYEQAINCLWLDRTYYGKRVLSITSKYLTVPNQPTINVQKLKKVSKKAYDDFRKIFVGNFPYMPDYQVMNILSEYGQLKSFVQIEKDRTSSQCFCQYVIDEVTDQVLNKLNNLKIKGRPIVAKRAALMNTSQTNKTKISSKIVTMPNSSSKSSRFQKDLNEFYATFDTEGFFKKKKISCVLLLKDIIPPACIQSPAAKQYILQDIKKQIERVGPVLKFLHKNLNIYIEYQRVQYSQIAYLLLSNRKYDGKLLQISFYDPIKFADDILI